MPLFHPNRVRFGRIAPASPLPFPALRDHLTKALPPAPLAVDWGSQVVGFDAFGNDTLNNCTVAMCANALVQWTYFNGAPYKPALPYVIEAYSRASGYVPGKPETDTGAYEGMVLGDWSRLGWEVGRQVPDVVTFGRVDPADLEEVKNAVHLFGGICISLSLPLCAKTQDIWDVTPGLAPELLLPGGWGQHAVYVVAFDESGVTCVTWGVLQRMTWRFFAACCIEAWAVFSRLNWLSVHGVAPNHYDLEALEAALPPLPALAA